MERYIDEKDVYKLVEPTGTARVHCSQIDELPRADVVPKSKEGAECPTCYGTGRIGTTDWLTKNISKKKLAEEKAKAIAEHEQYIKSVGAMEVFDRIEKHLARFDHIHRYAEEAYEVTEEYANGSPVEMTSVWDACRLEHNGYDDYETMKQLQDNIEYMAMSRLLKELESDLASFKNEYRNGGNSR